MSILPKCFVAPAISALTSSDLEMLQGMTCASPPVLLMPSATSLHASALREEITTLAPSCASNSAEARPMPRLEPVTTATWPVRSKGVVVIGVSPNSACAYWHTVMPGLDPGIHAFLASHHKERGWPGQAR